MKKKIGLLGSTGSIGTQTLDVVRNFDEQFNVVALSSHTNISLLRDQVQEFEPEYVAVSDPSTNYDNTGRVSVESLDVIARKELDLLVVAVSGMAGLLPTLEALKNDTMVALASKEAIVVGGPLIRDAETESRASVIPVDSEHHAVFQLMRGENKKSVKKIFLTASGGPFRNRSRDELEGISPQEALDHPNWSMGSKITIDSATMMNKGLELIEAHFLFDLEPDRLGAVIHPESKVHSLVEFCDGSVKAQLSKADMRLPIQSALFHPERKTGIIPSLDFGDKISLEFLPVELERFPAFRLAKNALKEGGTAPIVLNAANTVAVKSFLDGAIEFTRIPEVANELMSSHETISVDSIEEVLRVTEKTKKEARNLVENTGKENV